MRRARVQLSSIVENAVEIAQPAITAGKHEFTVEMGEPLELEVDGLARRRDEKALRGPASRQPAPDQPGRKHPGVVDDEQVSRRQERRQLVEVMVKDRVGGPVETKKTRLPTLGRRFLRDGLRRHEREG